MWTLGYTGGLDAAMPRQKREVLFGRGELIRGILQELRHATGPMSSRELAQNLVAMRGEDARDRKYVSELTRRVSKALRQSREEGAVRTSVDDKGNVFWAIREITPGRKMKIE